MLWFFEIAGFNWSTKLTRRYILFSKIGAHIPNWDKKGKIKLKRSMYFLGDLQVVLVLKQGHNILRPPTEKWYLCPLPWNIGSIAPWLIEHGRVMLCHFLQPGLKKLVASTSYCLGHSLLEPRHLVWGSPSCLMERPWVSNNLPVTWMSYLGRGCSPTYTHPQALYSCPVFSRAGIMRNDLEKYFLWYFHSQLLCSSFLT